MLPGRVLDSRLEMSFFRQSPFVAAVHLAPMPGGRSGCARRTGRRRMPTPVGNSAPARAATTKPVRCTTALSLTDRRTAPGACGQAPVARPSTSPCCGWQAVPACCLPLPCIEHPNASAPVVCPEPALVDFVSPHDTPPPAPPVTHQPSVPGCEAGIHLRPPAFAGVCRRARSLGSPEIVAAAASVSERLS